MLHSLSGFVSLEMPDQVPPGRASQRCVVRRFARSQDSPGRGAARLGTGALENPEALEPFADNRSPLRKLLYAAFTEVPMPELKEPADPVGIGRLGDRDEDDVLRMPTRALRRPGNPLAYLLVAL